MLKIAKDYLRKGRVCCKNDGKNMNIGLPKPAYRTVLSHIIL